MKSTTKIGAKVYLNNDWAFVYTIMSGLIGVVLGLIIGDFMG